MDIRAVCPPAAASGGGRDKQAEKGDKMTRSPMNNVKRIGLLSLAGAIVLSTATMTSSLALAAAPDKNSTQQWTQKNGQSHDQKGGQQWSQHNNQGQNNGQQWKQQNGQAQNQNNGQGSQHNNQGQNNGQQWKQQNGQAQNQNNGQGSQHNNQGQNNGQQWKQQNGQAQNQNNGQQWSQHNGQAQNQQWKQPNGQPRYTDNHRYDWSSYQPGHRPPEWQRYHNDFNPRPYQWNRTSNQRFRYQPYPHQYGWHYQRWVYGQILPSVYWGQNYWLPAYYNFGLIDPPYGFVWVRYGDDALLVNVENGQILSVEYNLFYS
jgi:Nickel/cobalt transporter regulator